MAAVIVGVGAVGLAIFSISRESSQRQTETTADSLVAINPLEPGTGNLTPSQDYQAPGRDRAPARRATSYSFGTVTIPAGSSVPVRISTSISSETADVGQSWSGVVTDDVYANDRVVVPAGTHVTGTVAAARAAERGSRAMLQLSLSRLQIGDRSYRVRGTSEPVIAGSPRARNLGAIAGGTAAGALVGRTVSGSGKGTLIGGLVGGAVATGVVAKSKGWQVVLKAGTPLSFTLRQSVAVSKRALNNQMAYQ